MGLLLYPLVTSIFYLTFSYIPSFIYFPLGEVSGWETYVLFVILESLRGVILLGHYCVLQFISYLNTHSNILYLILERSIGD